MGSTSFAPPAAQSIQTKRPPVTIITTLKSVFTYHLACSSARVAGPITPFHAVRPARVRFIVASFDEIIAGILWSDDDIERFASPHTLSALRLCVSHAQRMCAVLLLVGVVPGGYRFSKWDIRKPERLSHAASFHICCAWHMGTGWLRKSSQRDFVQQVNLRL